MSSHTRIGTSHEPRIAFVTPCVDEAFFDPVKKGALDAATALGASCRFVGTDDVDIDHQIAIVRQEIDDGCQALALSIVHPSAFDDLLDDLLRARTPLVAFNVDASKDQRLTRVCQDASAAGRTLGSLVAPSIRPRSQLLVTCHSEGISALDERQDGITAELRSKEVDVDVLVTGIDSSLAAEMIGAYLENHPEVHTIIGTGLADTEGAGLAVEALEKSEDYLVVGFDLSPNILRLVKNGIVAYTIDQQPYVQGFFPVVQLVHLYRYGIQPMNIDAGATVIGRENVGSIIRLSDDGYR